MIVEFKDNIWFSELKDIIIKDDKKSLKIFFAENDDLYLDIFGDRNKDENGLYTATFSINKNEEIYQYFENLYNSIIDPKKYDMSEIEYELCKSNNSANKIALIQKINENLKMKETYKKLVHNNSIVWYSDNIYDERANILKIKKDCDEIKLTFIDNPMDPSFGFGIRINNSRSKYNPYNVCFMNLFNQFQLLAKENSEKKLVKTEKSCK